MQNMETRALISRVSPGKGKFCLDPQPYDLFWSDDIIDTSHRFGWVNASYVYGLEILNAHQRRALGAITPFETYSRAIAMHPY